MMPPGHLRKAFLPAILALPLVLPAPAFADGGTVVFERAAGPFSVTLFAPELPLQAGQTDLSVLVQDRSSGEVLLDAEEEIRVTGSNPMDSSAVVKLAHSTTGNRLLQSAEVTFPRPGKWQIEIEIRRGSARAVLSSGFVVEPNRSRAEMVWFYLLLPAAVIVLFALHQFLKNRQGAGQ
jgi:hypothetical protein